MNILIVKLGATGDVVRTTPLLRRLDGEVTWLTAAKNRVLLQNLQENLRCFSWEDRDRVRDTCYDLVINLEDTEDVGLFLNTVRRKSVFGAFVDSNNTLQYTADSRGWFDLSLISRHGRKKADQLKFRNRRTYQDLVFSGLGYTFAGEEYLLPSPTGTDLKGDVAIAPEGGPVWPMKNWAYYRELKSALEERGWVVNVLPTRPTLLDHLCDVRNHRCLISGDSLPMHLALGTGTRCVTLFTCTSPWEIHEYGVQTKLVSPLLEQFFYQRGLDRRATTAIPLNTGLDAILKQIEAPTAAPSSCS